MKTILNKQELYFFIDDDLFKRLEELLEENNTLHQKGKNRLKLDVAVFIIYQIERLSNLRKDKLVNGYVRLKAKYLESYYKNYAVHINFLIKNGFIKRIPYSRARKESYGYKVIYPEILRYNRKNIRKYEPISFMFKKKVEKKWFSNPKKTADRKCRHLTKCLTPENIEIDYEAAIEYIHSLRISDNKLYNKRYCIEALNEGQIHYSRSGADDRLHSNLTNMPSDLRRFVFHKNQDLISLDLKSSQPYLLAGILNLCLLEDYDRLDKVVGFLSKGKMRKVMESVLSITIPKTSETLVNKEMRAFIDQIVDNDIYEYISDNYSEEFLDKITCGNHYQDKFYNEEKKKKLLKKFDSLRDFSKVAMLEYLYCSSDSREKRYLEIRRIFPKAVNDFVDEMKAVDKRDFPIILQNIEAHLFLDIITKEIANERPAMFITTIHDSIIVPEGNEDFVANKMMAVLWDTFGIAPEVKQECWCDEHLKMAS